jgi:hypothetical protein
MTRTAAAAAPPAATNFKVPKEVPKWVYPFHVFTNNVHVFQLYETHWENFFKLHFVPPKPRKPVDPMAQFEKGIKGISSKMEKEDFSEEEKRKFTEAVTTMVSSLPEDLKGGIVDAVSPLHSKEENPKKKRKRSSAANSPSAVAVSATAKAKNKKFQESYREYHERLLDAKGPIDVEEVMRVLDVFYDMATEVISATEAVVAEVTTTSTTASSSSSSDDSENQLLGSQ